MAPSPDRISILLPVAVAVTLTFCTVIIHALALMPIIYFVRYELRLGRAGVLFWRDVGIIAGVTLMSLAAHLIAVATWAFSRYAANFLNWHRLCIIRNELHDVG
jgi:hypothetical protein